MLSYYVKCVFYFTSINQSIVNQCKTNIMLIQVFYQKYLIRQIITQFDLTYEKLDDDLFLFTQIASDNLQNLRFCKSTNNIFQPLIFRCVFKWKCSLTLISKLSITSLLYIFMFKENTFCMCVFWGRGISVTNTIYYNQNNKRP